MGYGGYKGYKGYAGAVYYDLRGYPYWKKQDEKSQLLGVITEVLHPESWEQCMRLFADEPRKDEIFSIKIFTVTGNTAISKYTLFVGYNPNVEEVARTWGHAE
jgi:hypothetical protein